MQRVGVRALALSGTVVLALVAGCGQSVGAGAGAAHGASRISTGDHGYPLQKSDIPGAAAPARSTRRSSSPTGGAWRCTT